MKDGAHGIYVAQGATIMVCSRVIIHGFYDVTLGSRKNTCDLPLVHFLDLFSLVKLYLQLDKNPLINVHLPLLTAKSIQFV